MAQTIPTIKCKSNEAPHETLNETLNETLHEVGNVQIDIPKDFKETYNDGMYNYEAEDGSSITIMIEEKNPYFAELDEDAILSSFYDESSAAGVEVSIEFK